MKPISPSPERRLLVVGPGRMGEEYVKTLLHLGWAPGSITILGRNQERTEAFAARCGGIVPLWGGFEALRPGDDFAAAIIAVPPRDLPAAAEQAMASGVRRILLEKPGALSSTRMSALGAAAGEKGVDLFLAYNRRFYAPIQQIRRLIAEDGGAVSVFFDFSELESRILEDKAVMAWGDDVLARWALINSSHVFDTVAHLVGAPAEWSGHRRGALPWHPSGAVFWGSGVTETDVPFAYISNWSAAGRWGIEVTTPLRKIILRPFEAPSVQTRDGFGQSPLDFPAEPEHLKPGFYGLARAFLQGGVEADALCTPRQAADILRLAEKIAGYSD